MTQNEDDNPPPPAAAVGGAYQWAVRIDHPQNGTYYVPGKDEAHARELPRYLYLGPSKETLTVVRRFVGDWEPVTS